MSFEMAQAQYDAMEPPEFLDYLCHYCCEEEHDVCWDLKPDPDCVCCAETARDIVSSVDDRIKAMKEDGDWPYAKTFHR